MESAAENRCVCRPNLRLARLGGGSWLSIITRCRTAQSDAAGVGLCEAVPTAQTL